jgi:hypothetical protein
MISIAPFFQDNGPFPEKPTHADAHSKSAILPSPAVDE